MRTSKRYSKKEGLRIKRAARRWVESYFYAPTFEKKIVSLILLPVTAVYCFVVMAKRYLCRKKDYGIPVVSVGNLIIGGSGKTPFVIELAKRFEKPFVVLRGYKRKKRGTFFVSKNGEISCSVKECGDEALLIAKNLCKGSVIVCDKREEAINLAKEKGAEIVFLDDAFHICSVSKFDILIKSAPPNKFCIPSGPFREPPFFEKYANRIVKEGVDFERAVEIVNPTEKMVLVTAIANPLRIEKYLPENGVIGKVYFEDHHFFTEDEIERIKNKFSPSSLLVTRKDEVKLESFNVKLSILDLKINIKKQIIKEIKNYKESFYEKKDSDSSDSS